ncbi:DUF742 domain-containing protein [Nonomuraea maheshkhaliensis]|uniref:DUF742 domain-containing protein n=1 Tax=Nonomuraea maheshkhaliensis TaxID=419590 RepID=UPI0031F84CB8
MNEPAVPPEYTDQAVRPYVMTAGRVSPSRNTVGVDTLLMTASDGPALPLTATREQRDLLAMCVRLHPLVEAAARLRLPVSVVTIVACDLIDSGRLRARSPVPQAGRPDPRLLQELLDGLRKL